MEKLIATNKKAYYNYVVRSEIEAGLVLTGAEVKSIRQHHVSITEAYAHINRENRVEIVGMYIKPYKEASFQNTEPRRRRHLLLHKREIRKLKEAVEQKGMTLIPLKLVRKRQWVKLHIGVCQGKKLYDKRQVLKQREADKTMDQVRKQQGVDEESTP